MATRNVLAAVVLLSIATAAAACGEAADPDGDEPTGAATEAISGCQGNKKNAVVTCEFTYLWKCAYPSTCKPAAGLARGRRVTLVKSCATNGHYRVEETNGQKQGWVRGACLKIAAAPAPEKDAAPPKDAGAPGEDAGEPAPETEPEPETETAPATTAEETTIGSGEEENEPELEDPSSSKTRYEPGLSGPTSDAGGCAVALGARSGEGAGAWLLTLAVLPLLRRRRGRRAARAARA